MNNTPETAIHTDVMIVGAGLSGIGSAVHLQKNCPDRDYMIIERRDAIGGTWDLFKYPGIRSDSDMHTLATTSNRGVLKKRLLMDLLFGPT